MAGPARRRAAAGECLVNFGHERDLQSGRIAAVTAGPEQHRSGHGSVRRTVPYALAGDSTGTASYGDVELWATCLMSVLFLYCCLSFSEPFTDRAARHLVQIE
jgi:hypothetical protein